MRILFFDTETTGLPKNWNAPVSDLNNWPRLVQLAWQVYNEDQELLEEFDFIIKPNGFIIPRNASEVHKITTEKANEQGVDLIKVLELFFKSSKEANLLIAHNYDYDYSIMASELLRNGFNNILENKDFICTMKSTVNFCKISGPYGYKWPKLEELYGILFNASFNAHNALDDIRATARCFWDLKNKQIINIPDFFRKNTYNTFSDSEKWDTFKIIVTEKETDTEIINASLEKDLLYKHFDLHKNLHMAYNIKAIIEWYSIANELEYESIEWAEPGSYWEAIMPYKRYSDEHLDWVKVVNIDLPEDLHYDELNLFRYNFIREEIAENEEYNGWDYLGGGYGYEWEQPPFENEKVRLFSKDLLTGYFINLNDTELLEIISFIKREVSYRLFKYIIGRRWFIIDEKTKELVRINPEKYSYCFEIKNLEKVLLYHSYTYDGIVAMSREKRRWE